MKKVSILFALALLLGVTACNPSEKKEGEDATHEQHEGEAGSSEEGGTEESH